MLLNKPLTKTGVLVALIHELLNAERFETAADLKHAVKTRAARLRIPYDSAAIAEALDAVAHTREILPEPFPRNANPKHVERVDGPPPVPPEAARAILDKLRARVRPMPEAPPAGESAEAFEAARQRAWEMGIEL
jgi:hypothetical protein